MHGLPGQGTYYVTVEDSGGDDSDPTLGYSLELKVIDEPDPKDGPCYAGTAVSRDFSGGFFTRIWRRLFG